MRLHASAFIIVKKLNKCTLLLVHNTSMQPAFILISASIVGVDYVSYNVDNTNDNTIQPLDALSYIK